MLVLMRKFGGSAMKKRIVELWAAGLSCWEISAYLGCPWFYIVQVVHSVVLFESR